VKPTCAFTFSLNGEDAERGTKEAPWTRTIYSLGELTGPVNQGAKKSGGASWRGSFSGYSLGEGEGAKSSVSECCSDKTNSKKGNLHKTQNWVRNDDLDGPVAVQTTQRGTLQLKKGDRGSSQSETQRELGGLGCAVKKNSMRHAMDERKTYDGRLGHYTPIRAGAQSPSRNPAGGRKVRGKLLGGGTPHFRSLLAAGGT